MKIYFAGAIRGGRQDAAIYEELVEYLKSFGRVLTEHVGNVDLLRTEETGLSNQEIYARDMQWLDTADVVIAEVSTPSLGVGYEIGSARARKLNILCLCRQEQEQHLSAMIAGDIGLRVRAYRSLAEAKEYITDFLSDEGV